MVDSSRAGWLGWYNKPSICNAPTSTCLFVVITFQLTVATVLCSGCVAAGSAGCWSRCCSRRLYFLPSSSASFVVVPLDRGSYRFPKLEQKKVRDPIPSPGFLQGQLSNQSNYFRVAYGTFLQKCQYVCQTWIFTNTLIILKAISSRILRHL